MPFLATDHYTASSNVKLLNSWTDTVAKFDTSSFYNWEQDNLPLYDLEERTYHMWERAGYPTSSVPGMILAVSGDATASALQCNPNLFTTVSGALNALPDILRFPVILEIGSFGDLGRIEINNLKCEGTGSLEIINRNFGKIHAASSVGIFTKGENNDNVVSVCSLDLSTTFRDASCISLQATVLTPCATTTVIDSRFIANNRLIWQVVGADPTTDTRTSKLTCEPISRALVAAAEETPNVFSTSAVVYDDGANDATIAVLDISAVNQGTHNLLRRKTIPTEDINPSATGMIYGNYFRKIKIENCDGPIFLRNCIVDGNWADTASRANQATDIGIEINNSNYIVVENCAAERCAKAGIQFNNSKVVVTRGLVGYRNYELVSTTGRDTSSMAAGLRAVNSEITLSANATPPKGSDYPGIGAHVDFLLHFTKNDIGVDLVNSIITGGAGRAITGETASVSSTYFQASHNGRSDKSLVLEKVAPFGAGIRMFNSTLDLDGRVECWNNSRGIDATNSQIFFDEVSLDNNMYEGLLAKGSHITYNKRKFDTGDGETVIAGVIDQFSCSANGQHIVLDNSVMEPAQVSAMPTNCGRMGFNFSHGRTSLSSLINQPRSTKPSIEVKNGSKATFVHALINTLNDTAVDSIGGDGGLEQGHGIFGAAIAVTDNSQALFQGSLGGATTIWGPNTHANQKKTTGVYAGRNSLVEFNGPTIIARYGVDVLAEDHSTMSFKPPTVNGEVDVSSWNLYDMQNHTAVELHASRACLVANKKSTINMENLGDFHANWGASATSAVDWRQSESFDLSTFVSGGSMQFYPLPELAACNNELHGTQRRCDTQKGSEATLNAARLTPTTVTYGEVNIEKQVGKGKVNWYLEDPQNSAEIAKISHGGMCLRAVNDSQVNVKNVHFPAGWDAKEVSGIIYDASALCNQLRIWNIADTSRLDMSYISVSGCHPRMTQYHGPGAAWVSSNDPAVPMTPAAMKFQAICSGAPSATPDTHEVCILDSYAGGIGTAPQGNLWLSSTNGMHYSTPNITLQYADSLGNPLITNTSLTDMGVCGIHAAYTVPLGTEDGEFRNQGPFRLYFSVDPLARQLMTSPSGPYWTAIGSLSSAYLCSSVRGPVEQIFAQGYNLSSEVSSMVSGTGGHAGTDGYSNSSLNPLYWRPQLVKRFRAGQSTGSTLYNTSSAFRWYNCDEFVEDAFSRVFLDESAASTFANAWNGSLGTSRRPKLVTIYSTDTGVGGRDFAGSGDATGFGIGFKSSNGFDLTVGEN